MLMQNTQASPAGALQALQLQEEAVCRGLEQVSDAINEIGRQLDLSLARLRQAGANAVFRLERRLAQAVEVIESTAAVFERAEGGCCPMQAEAIAPGANGHGRLSEYLEPPDSPECVGCGRLIETAGWCSTACQTKLLDGDIVMDRADEEQPQAKRRERKGAAK